MNTRPSRAQIQENDLWKAAYGAALDSLSESTEFTETQREILAGAMAHAAFQLVTDWHLEILPHTISEILYRTSHHHLVSDETSDQGIQPPPESQPS
jgi:hypothetical protein